MALYNAVGPGQLALAVSGGATALTIPSGATRCLIQAEVADVRWRDDGTNPTTTVGFLLRNGDDMFYEGDLTKIRLIGGAGATINVAYYA